MYGGGADGCERRGTSGAVLWSDVDARGWEITEQEAGGEEAGGEDEQSAGNGAGGGGGDKGGPEAGHSRRWERKGTGVGSRERNEGRMGKTREARTTRGMGKM